MIDAKFIRKWLVDNDRNSGWLAEEARIGDATLSRMLNGHHDPSLKTLERVARVIGVPTARLIIDTEEVA